MMEILYIVGLGIVFNLLWSITSEWIFAIKFKRASRDDRLKMLEDLISSLD